MGINDAKPLEDKIRKTIDKWPHTKVGVCRVSLKTTEAEYVYVDKNGVGLSDGPEKMIKATLASASTPIFNDVVDNEFVDGGLRHIAPLGEAIKQGADEIYVILCEQFQENQKPNYEGDVGNVIKVAGYAVNTLVQGVLWNDVRACQKINNLLEGQNKLGYKSIKLHVYAPLKDIGQATDFSPSHIKDLMEYGKSINPVI
jgi:predicted patatin/cPLA2 family phospholipase